MTKVITIYKENNVTLFRVIVTNSNYNNKYNNILVTSNGYYRVYYTDNQKRFPILQRIEDV